MAQTPLPEHGKCFVCGSQNPHSIGIQWYFEDGAISGRLAMSEAQQGPPGHAHGGASAALLDEAMGAAVWAAGHRVMAVNLNVDYKAPVPLGVEVAVSGRVTGQEGRKVFAAGEVRLPDGTVAVSATGIYVEAAAMFEGLRIEDTDRQS